MRIRAIGPCHIESVMRHPTANHIDGFIAMARTTLDSLMTYLAMVKRPLGG